LASCDGALERVQRALLGGSFRLKIEPVLFEIRAKHYSY